MSCCCCCSWTSAVHLCRFRDQQSLLGAQLCVLPAAQMADFCKNTCLHILREAPGAKKNKRGAKHSKPTGQEIPTKRRNKTNKQSVATSWAVMLETTKPEQVNETNRRHYIFLMAAPTQPAKPCTRKHHESHNRAHACGCGLERLCAYYAAWGCTDVTLGMKFNAHVPMCV